MVGPGALFLLVLAVFYVSEDQSATIVVALGVAAYYVIITRSSKDANVVPPDADVIKKLQQEIAVLKADKTLERLSEENKSLHLQCQAHQKDVKTLQATLAQQGAENTTRLQLQAQRLQTNFDESQKSTAKAIARLQQDNGVLSEKYKQLQLTSEAEQLEKRVLAGQIGNLQKQNQELAGQIGNLQKQNQDLELKLNPPAAELDRLTPASVTAMKSEQVAQQAVERARCFHQCVKSDVVVEQCVQACASGNIHGGTYHTEWTTEKLKHALADVPYFQANPCLRELIIGALVAMREEADSAVGAGSVAS
jgi:hypothetical protein